MKSDIFFMSLGLGAIIGALPSLKFELLKDLIIFLLPILILIWAITINQHIKEKAKT